MKPLRWLVIAGLVLGLALAIAPPAHAENLWYVTTTDDMNDGACTGEHCSLREAINAANMNPTDADLILVDFDHQNVIVFQPLTPLPPLSSNITIRTLSYWNSTPPNTILDGSFAVAADPGAAGLEVYGDGNYIQGLAIQHFYDGIVLRGNSNHVEFNYIGTDGTTAQPNIHAGIVVYGSDNWIGGRGDVIWDGHCKAPCNVISGNGVSGILIVGNSNVMSNNLIGTDRTGTSAMPNGTGIQIMGQQNNIGVSGNVISGNMTVGVIIMPFGQSNVVAYNRIGTDVTGMVAVPNEGNGVEDRGDYTHIRGNQISGNGESGIFAEGHFDGDIWVGALGTHIQGNLIGRALIGTGALPNRVSGIRVMNPILTLIGTDGDGSNDALEGNLITEHSRGAGIEIQGEGLNLHSTARILGNTITYNGTGIWVYGIPNIMIGGSGVGEGNLLNWNSYGGIELVQTTGSVVQGNRIGIWPDGSSGYNKGFGIIIQESSNNTIGGLNSGEGNVIAFNWATGIAIVLDDSPSEDSDPTQSNSVLGNMIYENGGLGIDLGFGGVTPNDPGDLDTGPNQLQNFPELNSVITTDGSTISINGSLNSNPNSDYRIEFFANAACDLSGNGEGQEYIGSVQVRTGADGTASINVTGLPIGTVGPFITATATDIARNETSEFSACTVIGWGSTAAIVEAMQTMEAQVNSLVESGELGQQQGKMLNTVLDIAIEQVGKGNHQAAAAQMSVFIGKVYRYIEKGQLDGYVALGLVDSAQQVINLIENASLSG